MSNLFGMHISGIIIIGLILLLFLIAVITLFSLYGKYKRLQNNLSEFGDMRARNLDKQ